MRASTDARVICKQSHSVRAGVESRCASYGWSQLQIWQSGYTVERWRTLLPFCFLGAIALVTVRICCLWLLALQALEWSQVESQSRLNRLGLARSPNGRLAITASSSYGQVPPRSPSSSSRSAELSASSKITVEAKHQSNRSTTLRDTACPPWAHRHNEEDSLPTVTGVLSISW